MSISHLLPNLSKEKEMLKEIGVEKVEDLFSDIPEKAREEIDFWEGKTEIEIFRELYELSKRNSSAFDMPIFLGGGARIHYVPSAVIEVISRSEFYSSYTPYQPEVSQGVLQALFEYQSLIAELTGMEVANSSMYDGATALGEAVRMAYRIKKGEKVLIPEHLSWEKKSVLRNYLLGLGVKIEEIKYDREKGILEEEDMKEKAKEGVFAIYVEYPNYFGIISERVKSASEVSEDIGAVFIIGVDPIALGAIKPPSEFGADIVVGEGSHLGNPIGFGGPSLGIFATRKEYLMKMPGRLIGMGEDVEGRRAFLMILQAREQHIRRHRATSNICTNEALCAIASAVYLSLLGKEGMRRLAKLNIYLGKKLAKMINSLDGFKAPYFPGFHFNEFVVYSEEDPYEVHERLLSRGVHGGLILKEHFPELDHHALYATTEIHREEDYSRLISALKGRVFMGYRQARYEEPLIIELNSPGRKGTSLPGVEVEIPEEWERKELNLPEVSEPQVVRHYLRLSQMSYGVDTGPYPLGSCTMKYNLKIGEIVSKFPGFAYIHPYQDERTVQGALKILYELQEMTAKVTGMDQVSLQPSAGAQGEFAGMLIARAYFEEKGEERDEVIVPDSAHGTNPASAAMAGFKVIEIPSKEDGTVDLKALEAALSEKTAAMMLTNPNTLGIFESEILEISELVHGQGALLYYDGANLNGIMGYTTPGKMGFDMVHVNFHKTFSAPHGGGGPGAGAIGVKKFLEEFLPVPIVRKSEGKYYLDYSLSKSIGKIKSFYGNFLVLIKAYVYMKMAGGDLKRVTEQAVLNSNYLKRKIEKILEVPGKDLRKHEFVASAVRLKKELGITALDVSKALLDRGLHAPTMYFPLIVKEALMIEPTESEPKEELDRYFETLKEIVSSDPSEIKGSPKNTSVRRIKDVEANKLRIVTWKEMR